MMRHCDGQDPNLVRKVGDGAYVDGAYVPCDCGEKFDDVDYSVVYPHRTVIVDYGKIRAAIYAMPDSDEKYALLRHLLVCEDVEAFRSELVERFP